MATDEMVRYYPLPFFNMFYKSAIGYGTFQKEDAQVNLDS